MNLKTLIEKFFLANVNLSKKTRIRYRKSFAPLKIFEERDIKTITIDDLRQLYQNLEEKEKIYEEHPHQGRIKNKGYSPYTLHNYARCWRRLFKWAFDEGILKKNPAKLLKLPVLPEPDPKAIKKDDLLKLIKATAYSSKPERDEAIVRFIADTGARVGGCAGLVLSRLNVESRNAVVREKGKGGNGKPRSVYFNETTAKAIQTWLKVRPKTKDERVFMLNESGIYQMFKRLAKLAGISGPHNPHSFRHSFAIGMLSKGANLSQVSQTMGHSQITVTNAYYGQFPIPALQRFHDEYSCAPNGDEDETPKLDIEILPETVTDQPEDLEELITIPVAIETAQKYNFDLPASTLLSAIKAKSIFDAKKIGRDWSFSRGEFLRWLHNRYKPRKFSREMRDG